MFIGSKPNSSSDFGDGFIKFSSENDLSFYTYTFNFSQIKIEFQPYPDSPKQNTKILTISNFIDSPENARIEIIKEAYLNQEACLVVAIGFVEENSEGTHDEYPAKYYGFYRYTIFSGQISQLGFELKNVVDFALMGPFPSPDTADISEPKEEWVVFVGNSEGNVVSMTLMLLGDNTIIYNQELIQIISFVHCDSLYVYNDRILLFVATDNGKCIIMEYFRFPQYEFRIRSEIPSGNPEYQLLQISAILLRAPLKEPSNNNVNIFETVNMISSFTLLCCFRSTDINCPAEEKYKTSLYKVHINSKKNSSWKFTQLGDFDFYIKDYSLMRILPVDSTSTGRNTNLLCVYSESSQKKLAHSIQKPYSVNVWTIAGTKAKVTSSTEFSLGLGLGISSIQFSESSWSLEIFDSVQNLHSIKIDGTPGSITNTENDSNVSYTPVSTNGIELVSKYLKEFENLDAWYTLLKKNRLHAGGELFIDRMLHAAGINSGPELYPPTSYPAIKKLVNRIYSSQLDPLKINSLLFYLLLDYDSLVSRNQKTQLSSCFANDTQLPNHFQLLVRGYWCLDNNFVDQGLLLLSDSTVEADWAREIIYVACLSGCYSGARMFLDTVRPSVDENGSDSMLILGVYLNTLCIEDAFWFIRNISSQNYNSEITDSLLESMFEFCLGKCNYLKKKFNIFTSFPKRL
ncbi:hypothetical protein AYI68_g2457 [Smittium mucronatum]|uniref:ELYS-like domain-containing protein n=1 Tax=Smittium mucronatum TaxID=133383 RepID=A0A1R0H2L7_9FUNG|nr:hypothetical protein AYI68_g2457 [Smittium mucronatum]